MPIFRVVLLALAALTATVLAFPRAVPNGIGHLGSLVETFLPWLALIVPVLLGLAWWRRSAVSALAALLPAAAWLVQFGGHVLPQEEQPHHLVAVQHNVSDENTDPAGAARALIAARPDLIGLEELVPAALPTWDAALRAEYRYRTVHGTVGLWSRHPLAEAAPVDIRPHDVGPDWNRGLRAVARTPHGDIAIYVAHLPSVRIGLGGFDSVRRDESARRLGAVLAAEPIDRILLLGDLNSTVDDRGLRPVLSLMTAPPRDFAFSWPARAPLARVDQILSRAMTVTEMQSLSRTGSDHLPIAANIRL
ncbi:endonuclease/exonuclease/phosphatase family protein [Nonomuraea turkmeniaca]|uniref:Endonuclease/exonuclease/phosphatase family protein n=1 Tax=Nonomuraea turkmeniaca TaxID=103838 RepID=A0A5S4F4M9_9ACTN|nr:endonuclease/exonuclease/phosphatase family protein [Nonomuraea turkmeniaca]TMR11121.1 endonuclease/exonuclease/phosphatase family protein [Nonomuraea turkmeniaca]